MNKYWIFSSLILGFLSLQGCDISPGGMGTSSGGTSSGNNSCEAQCDRNATNRIERESCKTACRQKGTKIVSVDDNSTTFRNGVAVKNPLNERNVTASLA